MENFTAEKLLINISEREKSCCEISWMRIMKQLYFPAFNCLLRKNILHFSFLILNWLNSFAKLFRSELFFHMLKCVVYEVIELEEFFSFEQYQCSIEICMKLPVIGIITIFLDSNLDADDGIWLIIIFSEIRIYLAYALIDESLNYFTILLSRIIYL